MNSYSSSLIQNPPILIYGINAINPPEEGYLLMTDETPLLLTDGEFLHLA